ncbi:hypothetical protein D8B26_007468 [Coccidioides posadasii str. Silveira]|uniref:uncharacterized protein n=1 Tax=Coccidioides posadasii (strain RMSCC 757 / Silveira) TaxID=443226 RepID=UPI001BEEE3D5|nr:hypothetical protein D8B26_007468 [Coccidioides posadasii str. Silveira]
MPSQIMFIPAHLSSAKHPTPRFEKQFLTSLQPSLDQAQSAPILMSISIDLGRKPIPDDSQTDDWWESDTMVDKKAPVKTVNVCVINESLDSDTIHTN